MESSVGDSQHNEGCDAKGSFVDVELFMYIVTPRRLDTFFRMQYKGHIHLCGNASGHNCTIVRENNGIMEKSWGD